MRASCKALKIAIYVTCISFVGIIALLLITCNTNGCKLLDYILNIVIGVFGSGCVALLLAIPSYNDNKTKTLDKYWHEALRLTKEIYDINYLFTEYDENIIVSLVHEMHVRENYEKCKKAGLKLEEPKDQEYKNQLIAAFKKNHSTLINKISKENFDEYTSNEIDSHIETLRNKAKEIFVQFIKVSNEKTDELKFICDDIEFFSNNKEYNELIINIYVSLNNILSELRIRAVHMNLYLNGEGNESESIAQLFAFQHNHYSINIHKYKDRISYEINHDFTDKMTIYLDKLKEIMYDKQIDKTKLHPIEFHDIYK